MIQIEKTGDWDKLINYLHNAGTNIKARVSDATDNAGMYIEGTIKAHFTNQDLGWAAHKAGTTAARTRSYTKKAMSYSKKNLATRLTKLNIPFGSKEGKPTLAARLAHGGNQILIDTGSLMDSVTYKKISFDSGEVGANRMSGTANLAAIHEFGCAKKKIPARPFMKPSSVECTPKVIEFYKQALLGATK